MKPEDILEEAKALEWHIDKKEASDAISFLKQIKLIKEA